MLIYADKITLIGCLFLFFYFRTYLLLKHCPLCFIHIHVTDLNSSLLYFRQNVYRLETLVQSGSHDFGKLVQYVVHSPANNQNFSFHVSVLSSQ